jgi:hypothetical protein
MGAIEYRRGRLHIVDRALLESVVCECYPPHLKLELPQVSDESTPASHYR